MTKQEKIEALREELNKHMNDLAKENLACQRLMGRIEGLQEGSEEEEVPDGGADDS